MGTQSQGPTGPDLRAAGVALSELADGGVIGGHVDGEAVLVAKVGDELFAIGATCTHYGGPLAEGLVVGDTVRCPWHHACFSLRSGRALAAPALNPVTCWAVERRGERVHVTGPLPPVAPERRDTDAHPVSVVIIGGGACGDAAAHMLRQEGYAGAITIVGAEDTAAVDRPNLSKDYLAGKAPEEWIPLRPPGFYDEHDIRLHVGRRATDIDLAGRSVRLDDGGALEFGALLIATGAEPVRLPAAVDPAARVRYLRTLAQSRAIIDASSSATSAVVLGASFIGLEVAASLRARGLAVHVVAPEARPLERVLGAELGDFVRTTHEKEGVVFHLGRTAKQIDERAVTLDDGTALAADLVVAGIGVRPRDDLAARAGIATDRGIVVDTRLRTSAPGVFAAGDVARYPDPRTGDAVRIEHWVVAQRMGQTAARNMLGRDEPFVTVPFFWSAHFDHTIGYVGHAERWDDLAIDGDVAAADCAVSYRAGGRTLAVATIGRDHASLEAEAALEKDTPGVR